MSITNSVLRPPLQNKKRSENDNTLLELHTIRAQQKLKSTPNVAHWIINNFVACDRCFGFNPHENGYISCSNIEKICPECGDKGVRYISTANSKLYDYLYKNIY
jgi:hypothetical protein